MTKLEAVFEFEKDTKNTRRYSESLEGPPIIGTLYLQQWAAKRLGNGTLPARIRVVVTAEEATE